ncbi:hypothetical protein KY285_016737 [Solanum tuberosum]|nr:hypothetical protein KY285_016737 [Solanum tuberosum]
MPPAEIFISAAVFNYSARIVPNGNGIGGTCLIYSTFRGHKYHNLHLPLGSNSLFKTLASM